MCCLCCRVCVRVCAACVCVDASMRRCVYPCMLNVCDILSGAYVCDCLCVLHVRLCRVCGCVVSARVCVRLAVLFVCVPVCVSFESCVCDYMCDLCVGVCARVCLTGVRCARSFGCLVCVPLVCLRIRSAVRSPVRPLRSSVCRWVCWPVRMCVCVYACVWLWATASSVLWCRVVSRVLFSLSVCLLVV